MDKQGQPLLKKLTLKIFVDKERNIFIQLFRYGFVGGLSFAADFALLFILTDFFKIHYLASAVVSYIAGGFINYFLSVLWVYHHRSLKNKTVEMILFFIIGLAGLGLNELILYIFVDIFKIHYLLTKLISAVLLYLFNFFIRKLLLFNQRINIK